MNAKDEFKKLKELLEKEEIEIKKEPFSTIIVFKNDSYISIQNDTFTLKSNSRSYIFNKEALSNHFIINTSDRHNLIVINFKNNGNEYNFRFPRYSINDLENHLIFNSIFAFIKSELNKPKINHSPF